jgi:transcriptional regulator with XRE-family HTH domain
MAPIVEPKVRNSQAPKVIAALSNLWCMNSTVKQAFAARLHEICDDMGLPKERGRQTELAREFELNPNAVRKWLLGEGMPELDMAVRVADWADVNLNWLLQGVGPKRAERFDFKAEVINEAIKSLPRELGLDLVDNLRAKLERIGKIKSGDTAPNRYRTMLEGYEQEIGRKPQ